jgi:hypothetical protein
MLRSAGGVHWEEWQDVYERQSMVVCGLAGTATEGRSNEGTSGQANGTDATSTTATSGTAIWSAGVEAWPGATA